MAWNEPGGNNRDPWGGGNKQDGPPDLDEVVKKLKQQFGAIFGGGKGGKGGNSDGSSSVPQPSGGLLIIVILIAIMVWVVFTGFYIVEPAERGVEMRFGRYTTTTEPGPHWHFPAPIEEHVKVNVDSVYSFPHKAEMLTSDENIVVVTLNLQYRVEQPEDYLFRDHDPIETIKNATESALREVIGQNTLDNIILANRTTIALSVKAGVETLVQRYKTGLEVVSVNIQEAEAPAAVKEAFDDVIKAREDKERFENEAEAYASEIVPRAGGEAARMLENAKAYKARVVAEAEGESTRFSALLTEYNKAPEVTRQRLYLETIEEVFSNTSKVLMDAQKGGNVTYLPLDRLINQSQRKIQAAPPEVQAINIPSSSSDTTLPDSVSRTGRGLDRSNRGER